MKLWDKGSRTDKAAERFTIGRDAEFDLMLAPFDVLGSIAHGIMLGESGIITAEDSKRIVAELQNIYAEINSGRFQIEPSIEDIHTQVEIELTRRLGDAGKKIHSGRSRNDQVLVDIAMFLRQNIETIVVETHLLANKLLELSEKYKSVLLPGYTHFQVAMPSSFGLWFGAYAESLSDDLAVLLGIFSVINKNPLGSGAGYGSSFPLNRMRTTELLGFEKLVVNSVYAQMKRGKLEKITADGMGNIAATLAKMAMDITLYVSQNFSFISFPEDLTTGSSIMPHKKNPDIFELIRAKCNKIRAVGYDVSLVIGNLPSGYHRDMQIVKEILFPAFMDLSDCIQIMHQAIVRAEIRQDIMNNDMYRNAFSVEQVNQLTIEGVPFRDAYKFVASSIENGTFAPDRNLQHTHEGSIGNLCNNIIAISLSDIIAQFPFENIRQSYKMLLRR